MLFVLRKFKNEPHELSAKAGATLQRNNHGRWRIVRTASALMLGDAAAVFQHANRAMVPL